MEDGQKKAAGAAKAGLASSGRSGTGNNSAKDRARPNAEGIEARGSTAGLAGFGLAAVSPVELFLISRQIDLGRDYHSLFRRDHRFWSDNYRSREIALRNAALALRAPVENRDTNHIPVDFAGSFFLPAVAAVKASFEVTRRLDPVQVGLKAFVIAEARLARIKAIGAGVYSANAAATQRRLSDDSTNYARRASVLNIGIEAGNIARAGMAQASAQLASSYGQVQRQIGAFAKGFSEFKGAQQGEADF